MTSNMNLSGNGPESKRVFHLFGAWNDRKEEDWLRGMALQGWHLEKIGVFSYAFRRGIPADIVYRLDFRTGGKFDQKEYLGIFRDAGWEHVGRSGAFHYFRTPVGAGGGDPEIFTDAASRIAKYQRLLLLFLIFLPIFFNFSTNALWRHPAGGFWIAVRIFQGIMTLIMVYAIIRILLRIGKLKKAR